MSVSELTLMQQLIIYTIYILGCGHFLIVHSMSLANIHMHALTLHINACHKTYIHIALLYMHITCLYHYILLLVMSKPYFTCLWFTVWHALNLLPMNAYNMIHIILSHIKLTTCACTWFVSGCLTDALYWSGKTDFDRGPCHYDTHIIHYNNMNLLLLVALDQSYFAHPDYLVICCWIWATLLHLINITPVMGHWLSWGMLNCLKEW